MKKPTIVLDVTYFVFTLNTLGYKQIALFLRHHYNQAWMAEDLQKKMQYKSVNFCIDNCIKEYNIFETSVSQNRQRFVSSIINTMSKYFDVNTQILKCINLWGKKGIQVILLSTEKALPVAQFVQEMEKTKSPLKVCACCNSENMHKVIKENGADITSTLVVSANELITQKDNFRSLFVDKPEDADESLAIKALITLNEMTKQNTHKQSA